MFKVLENTYAPGDKTPTIREVAKRAKEAAAKAVADKLNRAQDSISPEQGIKTYYVSEVNIAHVHPVL